MEEPGSCCFLVQMKSGAVTSTWVDTSAGMVGMAAQEGISAGSLEVSTDEVGKAHGTSVGTLLEMDGRATCGHKELDMTDFTFTFHFLCRLHHVKCQVG